LPESGTGGGRCCEFFEIPAEIVWGFLRKSFTLAP
jgi:hypothetical protein